MFSKKIILVLILQIFKTAIANNNIECKTIKEAFKNGDPALNFRIRQEHAKQASLIHSRATTIRSKAGFQSLNYYKNYVSIEAINVSSIFGQHYNPAVSPIAKPTYTIISDPKGTGITNMNITSEWLPYTDVILGRQYISLDNERMIGQNDFRQYPTSFDAITIKNDFFNGFEIFYSFIKYINTYKNNMYNTDGKRKLNTNLFNLSLKDFINGQITAYYYSNNDFAYKQNSQNTFGVRVNSDQNFKTTNSFGYEFEVSHQKNKLNNPNKYSATYLAASLNRDLLELFHNWIILGKLGFEFSGKAFQFPLGTAYGFNGLAEGYTSMPDRGLIDYYVNLSLGQFEDVFKLTIAYHVFQFAKGSEHKSAGKELNLSASFNINKDLNAQLRFANLNARNNSTMSVKRISGQINYLML